MAEIKQKTRKKQLHCMCVQELSEYNFQFQKQMVESVNEPSVSLRQSISLLTTKLILS